MAINFDEIIDKRPKKKIMSEQSDLAKEAEDTFYGGGQAQQPTSTPPPVPPPASPTPNPKPKKQNRPVGNNLYNM
jgi:hypothetical protein